MNKLCGTSSSLISLENERCSSWSSNSYDLANQFSDFLYLLAFSTIIFISHEVTSFWNLSVAGLLIQRCDFGTLSQIFYTDRLLLLSWKALLTWFISFSPDPSSIITFLFSIFVHKEAFSAVKTFWHSAIFCTVFVIGIFSISNDVVWGTCQLALPPEFSLGVFSE